MSAGPDLARALAAAGLVLRGGVWRQEGLDGAFADEYLAVRRAEGRLHEDAFVRGLPGVPRAHPHAREWRARASSLRGLVADLGAAARGRTLRVVEVGCGNGWLSAALASALPGRIDCCGFDINPVELEQAARVFGDRPGLRFAYADFLDARLDGLRCDVVVVASALAYFPDAAAALRGMAARLDAGGAIHVLDSPIYEEHEVEAARARSRAYYEALGRPAMAAHYHHPTWPALADFSVEKRHDPGALAGRLAVRLRGASPFPRLVLRPRPAPR